MNNNLHMNNYSTETTVRRTLPLNWYGNPKIKPKFFLNKVCKKNLGYGMHLKANKKLYIFKIFLTRLPKYDKCGVQFHPRT